MHVETFEYPLVINGDNGSKKKKKKKKKKKSSPVRKREGWMRRLDRVSGREGAAVVVSRDDDDQIRKLTVDNRREVKVEPESERGWKRGKKERKV